MSKPSRWISYSHNPGKTVLSSCLKWHRVEEINTKIILMINSNIFVLGWAVLCSLHPKTCNKVNISQPFPPYKMRLHDFGFGVFHCCSCLWEIHCWGTFRTAVLGLGRGKLEGFLSPGTEMAPWGIQKGVRCESCRVWGQGYWMHPHQRGGSGKEEPPRLGWDRAPDKVWGSDERMWSQGALSPGPSFVPELLGFQQCGL